MIYLNDNEEEEKGNGNDKDWYWENLSETCNEIEEESIHPSENGGFGEKKSIITKICVCVGVCICYT